MNQPAPGGRIEESRIALNAASRALNALAVDADRDTLNRTAAEVGRTLIATAENEELWRVLSPERPAGNLDALERAQLRTVLTTNWVQTLKDLGYTGSPQADTYGPSFRQALSSLVNREGGGDVDTVRNRVLRLGRDLLALTALPPARASTTRLRRILNRTKRVVRSLAVATGLAAASAALVHVIMPANTATAIAAAAVRLLPGHVITTAAMSEVVIAVAHKAVEFTLDPALGRLPAKAPGDQQPDRDVVRYARDHLFAIALNRLGDLAVDWANVASARHADLPIEVTRRLVAVTMMQINITAVATASVVYEPAMISFADQLDGVLAILTTLEVALSDNPVDAAYVSAELNDVGARIREAQAQFDRVTHR